MKNQQQGQGGQEGPEKNQSKGGAKIVAGGDQNGQAGYSSAPEQEETRKEQKNMHNERRQSDLNKDKGEQMPEKEAGKPATGKGSGPVAAAKQGQQPRQAQR